MYQRWQAALYPHTDFDDFILKAERVGQSYQLKMQVRQLRDVLHKATGFGGDDGEEDAVDAMVGVLPARAVAAVRWKPPPLSLRHPGPLAGGGGAGAGCQQGTQAAAGGGRDRRGARAPEPWGAGPLRRCLQSGGTDSCRGQEAGGNRRGRRPFPVPPGR